MASDIVLDVGANAGYYSLLAATHAARVHAIEPSPGNLRILRRNVKDYRNIVVHPYAASDRAGEASFTLAVDGVNDSLRDGTPYAAIKGHSLVQTARLDDIIPEGRVDLIKMDIQGAEPLALRGMTRLVEDSADVVLLIEWSPACLGTFGFSAHDLLEELRALGLTKIEAIVGERRTDLAEARSYLAENPRNYCNLIARHDRLK